MYFVSCFLYVESEMFVMNDGMKYEEKNYEIDWLGNHLIN